MTQEHSGHWHNALHSAACKNDRKGYSYPYKETEAKGPVTKQQHT